MTSATVASSSDERLPVVALWATHCRSSLDRPRHRHDDGNGGDGARGAGSSHHVHRHRAHDRDRGRDHDMDHAHAHNLDSSSTIEDPVRVACRPHRSDCTPANLPWKD